jgi:hypothetical protein
MTHGGVLGGILRDIGRTSGITQQQHRACAVKQPTSKQGNRCNAGLINKRMTHGGVLGGLGGMLRDIGGTFGVT